MTALFFDESFEPTDAELDRRAEALRLPADDPRRRWEEFARLLAGGPLTTITLERWLAVPVHLTLRRREAGPALGITGGQHRTISLTGYFPGPDGRPMSLPLCHATAEVALDRLEPWAVTALTETDLPLGRVLERADAIRTYGPPVVDHPQPPTLDELGMSVRGEFRLRSGELLARVHEEFTGHVLDRAASADPPIDGAAPAAGDDLDHLDRDLLDLLDRRRAAAAARHGRTTYPIADRLLLLQATHRFGHERGRQIVDAITGRDWPVRRPAPRPAPHPTPVP